MSGSTREWVNFFLKAGVPSDDAASYALIFCKNRIQKNMLVDLTKDYLRDMGITPLGDIIAILKHAKTVHENADRAMIMSEALVVTPVQLPPSNRLSDAGKSTPHSSSTVKRLLDQFSVKYKEAEENLASVTKKTVQPNRAVQQRVNTVTAVSDKAREALEPKAKLIRIPPEVKQEVESYSESEEEIEAPPKQKAITSSGIRTQRGNINDERPTVLPARQTAARPSEKKQKCVFTRLGGAAPVTQEPVTALPKPSKIILGSKRDPTGNIKKSTPTGMRSSEFKMIKITTEFSDDDDIEINNPTPATIASKITTKPKEVVPKVVRKRMYSDDVESQLEPTNSSASKKVRFGGTSTRTFPTQGSVLASSIFKGHTVIVKSQKSPISVAAPTQSQPQEVKMAKLPDKRLKPLMDIKARIGVVRPTLAQPLSKMVSDSILAKSDTPKKTIKSRVDLKSVSNKSNIFAKIEPSKKTVKSRVDMKNMSNKSSVLDRLG